MAHAQVRFCYHTEGPPQDQTPLVFRVDDKTRRLTHSLGPTTTLNDRPKSASPNIFRVDTEIVVFFGQETLIHGATEKGSLI